VSTPGLKAPVQKRSQASLERLLTAGAKLLETRGYAGFTIPEVSRRAKVSPGLIYGRFDSKAALFHSIHDRELERIGAETDVFVDVARWEGLGLAGLIDGVIAEAATLFERHAALLNVFLARGAVDPVVRERGAVFIGDLNTKMKALLLSRRDEISRPDPERAATMCCQVMISAFVRRSHLVELRESLAFGLPWDEMVTELAAVCRAYLVGPAAPRRPRERVRSSSARAR
jgi:AcrR family transcriptional regulator